MLKTSTKITYFRYYGMIMAHLTVRVILYGHPEDGQITGRNMLVNLG